MAEEAGRAIGFSITTKIDDQKGIVAQTHVDQDWSAAQINVVLDKVMAVLNRQSAIGELAMWENRLYSAEKNIVMLTDDIARNEANEMAVWEASGRKGTYKPTQQTVGNQNSLKAGLKRSQDDIETAKERIAACKAKIGDGA